MVKVRLQRLGTKHKPKYRIVVASEQVKQGGKTLEIIGNYNPSIHPPKVEIKKDRFDHWLNLGAQPTNSVTHLVKRYERANRISS